MKENEKVLAIRLRKRGLPYGSIRERVGVSKSTLSLWLRDIDLSQNQKEKVLRGRELSRQIAAQKKRNARLSKTHETIERGRKEFPALIRNHLFLSGLSLYWAEGDKHKQEKVKFTNSDAAMIALMMRWFREVCGVPESKFRIALHIHNLHMARNTEAYWRKITRIPKQQFQKTFIKESSLRHRRNILYKGTCAIVVNSKDLFRKIMGWKLGLLDYFSIPQ